MTSRIRVIRHRDPGDEQQTKPCPICEGIGQVWDIHVEYVDGKAVYEDWLPCPDCGGSGKRPYWQETRRD